MDQSHGRENGRIIGFMLDKPTELNGVYKPPKFEGVYKPVYRFGGRLRCGYKSTDLTRDWFSKGVRQGRVAAFKEPCEIADHAMVFALSSPDLLHPDSFPNAHEIHGFSMTFAVLKLGDTAHRAFFGAWGRIPESKIDELQYVCAALIMDHYLVGNPRLTVFARVVKAKLKSDDAYVGMKKLVDRYAQRFGLPPPVLE